MNADTIIQKACEELQPFFPDCKIKLTVIRAYKPKRVTKPTSYTPKNTHLQPRHLRELAEAPASYLGYPLEVLIAAGRHRPVAEARQMIWYALHYTASAPVSVIGVAFNRHHGTVIHGISQIAALADVHADVRFQIAAISELIKAHISERVITAL